MNDLLIPMAISILLQVVKTSSANSKWREAFLKVFRTIAFQFNTDPDFQKAAVENLAGVEKK